jgi:hypothetical protein
MRFILKNPFSTERSLNKISSSIDPIMLLKYKFIGEITFTRREGLKDISYGFLLLKNIDGEKIDYHYIKGVYSHFSFIDVRLQQSDINTIFPLKNITWDEFNMVYKWLKKPIYYYKDNPRMELVHFFVHNTKYQIPPELASKIERVKDNIYAEFNITYKDFYNKTNSSYLLKNTDIDMLWDSYSKDINKNIPSLHKIFNRKLTLILRPIKLILDSPHVLAGFLGYHSGRSFKIVNKKVKLYY